MSNKYFFVPDDVEVYSLASQQGDELPSGLVKFSILSTKKVITAAMSKCIPVNESETIDKCPEDLVILSDVNQASILNMIRNRFQKRMIYTSCGFVLIAMNPFERIRDLCSFNVVQQFNNPLKEPSFAHVFSIPSRAYFQLCKTSKSQSILISGESGAGKTEAAKDCLSFLTQASTFRSQPLVMADKVRRGSVVTSPICQRIIAASPILEAFGNAQTIRNPNSSRFGKWMELQFSSDNIICSSNIVSYLLEKSRVTHRNPKERNYHIFYQLLKGFPEENLREWCLTPSTQRYRYLVRSEGSAAGGDSVDASDVSNFNETIQAFHQIGFSEEEVRGVLRIVCGVLALGNVEFMGLEGGEASQATPTGDLQTSASLFDISSTALGIALCSRSFDAGGRKSADTPKTYKTLNPQKACDSRDCLSRSVYERLFLSIIGKINQLSREASTSHGLTSRTIGLLDIFGFEIFQDNSLEQLCINYCNEILQGHFNFVIFTTEKSLYLQEGVVCDSIEFKDNELVIREIEKLFKSLEEEARVPQGSSKTWFEKSKKGEKMTTVTFLKAKEIFGVKHYAGVVEYSPTGFLEKNVEMLHKDLVGLMAQSSNPLILRIFENDILEVSPPAESPRSGGGGGGGGGGKGSGGSSLHGKGISWHFQKQLTSLVTMLKATDSHFIRCIKSNDRCLPFTFEAPLVNRQLNYSGIFEVAKIQQSGFPCRLLHADFVEEFKCLAPSRVRYSFGTDSQELVRWLVGTGGFELPNIRYGKTKVFYKGVEQGKLEFARITLRQSCLTAIQKVYRGRLIRKYFERLLPPVRLLPGCMSSFDLSGYEKHYQTISEAVDHLHRLRDSHILIHLLSRYQDDFTLLKRQVEVLERIKDLIRVRSPSNLEALDLAVQRALEVKLHSESIVVECRELIRHYRSTLSFLSIVGNREAMGKVSLENLEGGIKRLNEFQDVVPQASEAVSIVMGYVAEVKREHETFQGPFFTAFELGSMIYDGPSGLVVPLHPESFEEPPTLSSLADSFDMDRLVTQSSKDVLLDFRKYLHLRDVLYPNQDPHAVLIFLASHTPLTQMTQTQWLVFKQWADLEIGIEKVRRALQVGKIPGSDLGQEEEVQVEDLRSHMEFLKQKPDLSKSAKMTVNVASVILKLREDFLSQQWDRFESRVAEVKMVVKVHNIFDTFPDSQLELLHCEWQVPYRGLMEDMLFICNEECFRTLSVSSDDWRVLGADLDDSFRALGSSQEFSKDGKSPKLLELNVLVDSVLTLRCLMFDREIRDSKAAATRLMNQHADLIQKFSLQEPLQQETDSCLLLLSRIDAETKLDEVLRSSESSSNNLQDQFTFRRNSSLRPYFESVIDPSDPSSPNKGKMPHSNKRRVSEMIFSTDRLAQSIVILAESINALDELLPPTGVILSNIKPSFEIPASSNNSSLIAPTRSSLLSQPQSSDLDSTFQSPPRKLLRNRPVGPSPEEIMSNLSKFTSIHVPIDSLVEGYYPRLNEQLQIARRLLFGRQLLFLSESTQSISWEQKINIMMSVPVIPDYVADEFVIISDELYRRLIHQKLSNILSTKCVTGTVGKDFGINTTLLMQQRAANLDVLQNLMEKMSFVPDKTRNLQLLVSAAIDLRQIVADSLLKDEWGLVIPAIVRIVDVDCPRGKAVSGFTDEVTEIKAEYVARNNIKNLRHELENLKLSSSKDLIVDTSAIETLPLVHAMSLINFDHKFQGAKLHRVGQTVLGLLQMLIEGGASTISEEMIEELIKDYQICGLKDSCIIKIKLFIKIRQFLGTLTKEISKPLPAKEIYENLISLKNSLSITELPEENTQWFEAAISYCNLLAAIEEKKWTVIVERARALEEFVESLTAICGPNGDSDKAKGYTDILRSRYKEAYSLALDLRSEELRLADQAVGHDSALTSLIVRKKLLLSEDRENHFGVQRLREAGNSEERIVEMKIPLRYFWACDVDPALLRVRGHSLSALRDVGYSPTTLLKAGFSPNKMREADYTASTLRAAGLSISHLQIAGFSEDDILRAGFTLTQLKAEGYNAGKLAKQQGLGARDLLKIGFTVSELRAAGFNAAQLRHGGVRDVMALREAGFDIQRLKVAGFNALELKESGFDFQSLQGAGFSEEQLFECGFVLELERQALMDLFEATNGRQWRVRLNWATQRPLWEWYGISCAEDEFGDPRVVAIDLHDNLLSGPLPSSLSSLRFLRSLLLQSNNLTGPPPKSLFQLRLLQVVDLSGNPSFSLDPESSQNPHSLSLCLSLSLNMTSPSTSPRWTSTSSSNNFHQSSFPTFMEDFPSSSPSPHSEWLGGGLSSEDLNDTGGVYYDPQHLPNQSVEDLWANENGAFEGLSEEDNEEKELSVEQEERAVLSELFQATNGSGWKNRKGWDTSLPLNNWFGISVNKEGRVVKVVLAMNGLRGSLPPSLGRLQWLRELDMRYNSLHGSIPSSICHLSRLTHLYLHCNSLSGPLPRKLGSLSRLVMLDVRSNQLTGKLPESISQLSKLCCLATNSNMIQSQYSVNDLKRLLPSCRSFHL